MINGNKTSWSVILTSTLVNTALVNANDNYDLDDIKLYDIVKVKECLDQAYDTVPGHARKLEFKIEGDDPIYEFDIQTNTGHEIKVDVDAVTGKIEEADFELYEIGIEKEQFYLYK